LNRSWSVVKNEIIQRMRVAFLTSKSTLNAITSQRTVDANMPHEIDPKVLDDLLNENPATLLRKGDSKLQTLAQFLLRYVILCKPKELLVNELHCNQAKAYEEDPATEKQDKFDCALDYYSPVIVAMVWSSMIITTVNGRTGR
jgi:hypothetical protein